MQAKVYKIFIASPSDVNHERQLVAERIHSWNDQHNETFKIILLPLMYEKHTPSRIGPKPQDVIDDYVLSKADFLIAIFWYKVGSGATEGEIDKHIKQGKQAALLFCKRKVPLGEVDDVSAIQEKFKKKSFYFEFTRDEELKDYIDITLHQFVQEQLNDSTTGLQKSKNNNFPYTTYEKKILLTLAETNRDLIVGRHSHLDGSKIYSNDKVLFEGHDSKERARWISGIQKLETAGLLRIELPIGLGNVYTLTSHGWDFIDSLKTPLDASNGDANLDILKEYKYLLNIIDYKLTSSKSFSGNLLNIHNRLVICFNLENLDVKNMPIKKAYATMQTNRGPIRFDGVRIVNEKGNTSELQKIIDIIKPNESKILNIMFTEESTQTPIKMLQPKSFKLELILPNEYHLEVDHVLNTSV